MAKSMGRSSSMRTDLNAPRRAQRRTDDAPFCRDLVAIKPPHRSIVSVLDEIRNSTSILGSRQRRRRTSGPTLPSSHLSYKEAPKTPGQPGRGVTIWLHQSTFRATLPSYLFPRARFLGSGCDRCTLFTVRWALASLFSP